MTRRSGFDTVQADLDEARERAERTRRTELCARGYAKDVLHTEGRWPRAAVAEKYPPCCSKVFFKMNPCFKFSQDRHAAVIKGHVQPLVMAKTEPAAGVCFQLPLVRILAVSIHRI